MRSCGTIEQMFDSTVVVAPGPGCGDRLAAGDLDGDFDGTLEWLLDGPDQVPPVLGPADCVDDVPAATYGSCAPSGWLALELDSGTADPAVLSDASLIEGIVGFERVASWAAARQARLLAELGRRRPADRAPSSARWACVGSVYAPDEIGVALTLARGTAGARLGLAHRLLSVLPDTHARWEAGRIDTLKARAIHDATSVLSDEHARAVQARVLPRAPEQTLAQLKAALARAVLAVDPAGADARHTQARRDRRVVVTPEADGMASLWALLTATDAAGAYTWLTRLARGLGSDDPRGMDTRRADLLAALLTGRLVTDADATDTTDTDTADTTDTDTGLTSSDTDTGLTSSDTDRAAQDDNPARPGTHGHPHDETACTAGSSTAGSSTAGSSTAGSSTAGSSTAGSGAGRPIHPVTPGKPLIQIVIAHSTLIGIDDLPAELVGHGPIPAGLAREAAADAVWHRLVTDPLSGTLLDYGRTTYQAPAGLADHVRARDQHCRFPGCRRTAADAELDHVTAWADGGATSASNLHALCGHHHRLKHHTPWRVKPSPTDASPGSPPPDTSTPPRPTSTGPTHWWQPRPRTVNRHGRPTTPIRPRSDRDPRRGTERAPDRYGAAMIEAAPVRFGAIEAGGTKFVCLLGSSPDDVVARTRIPTGEPGRTLTEVMAFFGDSVTRHGPVAAVGIASFGPVELRPGHPHYGYITSTPKPGWRDVDLVGPVRAALRVPVGFDTDVAGAALGEGRWGAARGLDTFVYLTVGTGIGGAAVVGGRLATGVGHAEMGHVSIPRQPGDTFAGGCPYHGDCLEGMAAGGAIAARFGRPAEQLDGVDLERTVSWEAGYLAAGVRTIVYTLAPQRIVIGGSIAQLPGLFPALRRELVATLAGYGVLPEHTADDFVVPAGLGSLAGPAGALVLAENALHSRL
jgi:fructokinase